MSVSTNSNATDDVTGATLANSGIAARARANSIVTRRSTHQTCAYTKATLVLASPVGVTRNHSTTSTATNDPAYPVLALEVNLSIPSSSPPVAIEKYSVS